MEYKISIEDLNTSKTGRLTAIKDLPPVISKSGNKTRMLLCLCTCGEFTRTTFGAFRSGHTKSCGCLIKDTSHTTHGFCSGSLRKFYLSWNDMKRRCDDPTSSGYKNYGGIGISYPEEWGKIEGFAEDMLPDWEEGLTLERIDPSKNYSKENCTWATMSIQSHNKNKTLNTSSRFKGVYFHKASNKWLASIGGKVVGRKYLGLFRTEEEAAIAYNEASLEIFGDAPNKI